MSQSQDVISRELIRQCVTCGMCLSACPTFRLTGSELDSPRGRIFQMELLRTGEITAGDPDLRQHIDFCLGCRACETACPSGVQYGLLIEQARAALPAPSSAGGVGMLRWLVSRKRALRLFALGVRLYQRLGIQRLLRQTNVLRLAPVLRRQDELLPALEGGVWPLHLPGKTLAAGEKRGTVALLEGCIMGEFMPVTNRATVDVLARNGFDVIVPGGQGCCGALHLHGGDPEQARQLAMSNIDAFESADAQAVIVNAAGCGSALKEYHHLFPVGEWRSRAERFALSVRDVHEFLDAAGLVSEPGRLPLRVTYQDACHLAHGQRVREQPRRLLEAIPGLELVEMEHSDWCCGSAGTYNLEQPEASAQLLDEKIEAIKATGVNVVAAANPGCIFQIVVGARRAGLDLRVAHPLALLAEAYAAKAADQTG